VEDALRFRKAEGKAPVYFDGHPEPYIELVKELTPPENAISASTDAAILFRTEASGRTVGIRGGRVIGLRGELPQS